MTTNTYEADYKAIAKLTNDSEPACYRISHWNADSSHWDEYDVACSYDPAEYVCANYLHPDEYERPDGGWDIDELSIHKTGEYGYDEYETAIKAETDWTEKQKEEALHAGYGIDIIIRRTVRNLFGVDATDELVNAIRPYIAYETDHNEGCLYIGEDHEEWWTNPSRNLPDRDKKIMDTVSIAISDLPDDVLAANRSYYDGMLAQCDQTDGDL